jgi:hypothetical protein
MQITPLRKNFCFFEQLASTDIAIYAAPSSKIPVCMDGSRNKMPEKGL